MKRISLMLLCLCAAAWTSGCCHSHYSRCGDFDDNCDCNQTTKRSRGKRCRGDKAERGARIGNCDECCGDCSNSCCGESGTYPAQSGPPATYEGGAPVQSGCANCGTTSMTGSMPMYGGTSYNGMPFPPGEGWTLQSTSSQPVGNEPVAAPGSTPTPITPTPARAQGWTNPSSVPVPAPVPPPVSSRVGTY